VRGLLRAHPERLERVNRHDGVLVLITPPDCAADRGAPLGVVKCAPLFLAEDTLQAVEAYCANAGGVLEIVPFRPHRVAFIASAERLRGNAFQRSTHALRTAIDWFGSSLDEVVRAGPSVAEVASGFRLIAEHQAEVILAGGAPATDPLDSVFEGLRQAGGEIEQIGIPAEPGTACWLGSLNGRPVLGLASCELFGQPGALDVLLPRIFAGEHLDRDLLRRIAVGGLLVGGPSRILPYHVAESA
jgi:hypothetical protein